MDKMSDDSGRRVYKVRGGGLVTAQPTVASLTQTSTQSNLLPISPVVVQSQTGVTLMQSTVMHTKSLMHADAQPEAQSQTQIQSQTHVQSQPLLQTQSQVLPLTQGDTRTATQPQTQTPSLAQLTPRTLAQSLVYSNPHMLTQSQVHTQSQMHTQSQGNTQTHMHIQPQLHTHSQLQVQSLTQAQPQMQLQSQLRQMPLQTQLPTLTHATVISTMADLVDATQIESSSSQQSTKSTVGLEVMQVPVTRQHSSPSVTLQDLHSSVSISDELPNNSQAQLMHTLATFPQTEHLNTTAGLQQGNTALLQTLPQPLTQTQILDAFTVERVLMSSRNSLGQTAIPPASSVEIDGISVMRVQEGFNTRPNHLPSLATSVKESSVHNSPVTTQLACSQRSAPLLDASSLEASQLSNLHTAPQDDTADSLSKKPTTTTTTSTLIASNRMLNKLLDTAKPHIPSQVTKAAEIAHLVPNPSVRLSSTSRLGDVDDAAEMVFTTCSRGSSPLTTLTRSSAASMCTVTGALRGSSGYGDSVGKAPASVQLDGIFGLPSNFQVNNTTLVLPSSISHSQIIPQRQFDTIQQVLLGSQSMSNAEQLEGLSTDSDRVLPSSLSANQQASATTCSISGNNNLIDVSSLDKSCRKTGPSITSQVVSNTKMFNVLGLPEGMNKSGVVLDSPTRSHSNSCTKTNIINSTDPMFPPAVVTSGCCSPVTLGTVPSRLGSSPQEGSCRVRGSNNDARVSHQTLVDLLGRGPSSETGVGSGTGIPLIGLSESHLPHTGDVLLSELHRSDESDLSLSASLTGASGEELHSNPSGLVTEASLVTGIGGDTAPLQGLPSPPLPSFSLPSITVDLLGGGVSGSKTCPSGQGPLPGLLSNLATTADLDQFLDNSNMCIDINSLSESEVYLSTGPGPFTYSPEKPGNSKKSGSGTSSELTFTNALKAATTKSDSEQIRLRSESESPAMILNQDQAAVTETTKALHNDVSRLNSASCTSQTSPVLSTTSDVAQEIPSAKSKKTNTQVQTKPSQNQTDKRKEVLKKNELLVQQVACFKCRLCSFLSQDKSEMVNHMKEQHSQYLSDTDESEEEVEKPPTKRVKVLVPRNDKSHSEESVSSHESTWCVKTKKGGQKRKADQGYKMEIYNPEPGKFKNRIVTVEEEQVSGRIGIFIKTEPKDVGEFEGGLLEKEEEEDLGVTIELGETTEPGSDHEFDDEDTNDSSATNDSGSIKPSNKKPGRPLYSKTTGITKFKKKNPKVKLPDEVLGIRCDVNGCGLRMKSENNIAYHRKCHVNNKLKCQECSCTKFQSWRDLALHLWRQHLIDMELHKCDKCDYKSYSYSKLMNIHHKSHSDERPSLCDTCGKRFKTDKQLRSHKALHMKKSEAPEYLCEICQRPFSDKRMLRNHQESVHKKVKPFLCNYCGYSTASKSTLKMHMRQHTGEKPFVCDICKYRTSDHNSLRRHKMQHTGVRPYRCPYCHYASIQSTTFKAHLKDKHPGLAQLDGIMFACGLCSFKTVKRDNYLAHVAEHGRCDSKKQCQSLSPNSVRKTESPQAILSDLTPPPPHVVNIDVDSGAVTVESPNDTDYLNAVHVQTPVPGQLLMAGDQYIYATVDSSVLSQVRSGEGVVHLTQDMVGVPISIPLEASSASSLQGLVYVATTSQGGQ